MLSVIIVAAGSSRRMGFDKLMSPLNGQPILYHTINALLTAPEVGEVILVSTQERYTELKINHQQLKLVAGGAERHHSVANGIAATSPDASYIAVHDGARPLITHQQITNVLNSAREHGAATSARKVTETVKLSNDQQFAIESVSRENLWLMETPQIFKADLLRQAYQHIQETGTLVTDEVSALELLNIPTYLAENATPNPKITFPHDLVILEGN